MYNCVDFLFDSFSLMLRSSIFRSEPQRAICAVELEMWIDKMRVATHLISMFDVFKASKSETPANDFQVFSLKIILSRE